jgi:transglutaminase-like putative cysteine protease
MRITRHTGRSIHQAAKEALPATALLLDLGIVLLLISAPLILNFPKLLIVYIGALYLLHFLGSTYRRLRIALLPIIFMFVGIWLVLRYYRTITGYEAGMALFTTLLGPKLLEIRRRRDFNVTVTLGLFLIVMQFLLNQSLLRAMYMLPLVVMLLTTLIQSNRATPLPRKAAFNIAGRMIIQALPLMIMFFVLFPRLSQPLWTLNLKLDRLKNRTGLSEEMVPGSIHQLMLSQDIAFRAELQGKNKQLPEWNLYWRGPVLWRTDGLRWFGGVPYNIPKSQLLINADSRIDYRVILEPHGKKWILALDLPAESPRTTQISTDFQVHNSHPIDQRSQFFLTSFIDYRTDKISATERTAALQLPKNVAKSQQLIHLVNKLQFAADGEPRRVVEQTLDFFRQEKFSYTLTPPPLGSNGIETFLFETKAGFCEHYAGAFTLLMRIAGIPSRVVTGYLGGEYNELGNYYLIRQELAHAWSEVWLKDIGWMRVDPTAAIAPERIQRSGATQEFTDNLVFNLTNIKGLGQWLHKFNLAIDAINTRWHMWVLGYDTDKQEALLDSLGLGFLDRIGMAIIMIILTIILGGILSLFLANQQPSIQDEPLRLYQRLCKRLATVGILRPDREGPQDLANRVARRRPDLANDVIDMINLYLQLRYAKHSRPDDLQILKKKLAAFKPKRVY